MHTLTDLFTKKKDKVFLLHEKYPRSTQSQSVISAKYTVVFVQLCCKKKGNVHSNERKMRRRWAFSV